MYYNLRALPPEQTEGVHGGSWTDVKKRIRNLKGSKVMVSKFSRLRVAAAASAMAVALTFAAPAAAFTSLAATGTITGSSINVRGEASTTGSIVGTLNTGDTVTVGESTTDDAGATWYQVTLSNGTTGYVRGDYITVSDDGSDASGTTDGSAGDSASDGSGDASSDASSDSQTDSSEAASTETSDPAVSDATAAAEQDTGGYSIVLAPDGDSGEKTYYLYDNNNSVRMKISDIQKLPDEVTAAQQEAQNVRTRYRIYLIVLAAACAALLIGCIVLGMRLRDALANGRRERDLTMERRDQRRNNRNADSVESLRHGRPASAPSRTGRGRDDAYASGASRYGRDYDDRDIRSTRTSTTSSVHSARRPAADDDYAGRTPAAGGRESSRPVRGGEARPSRETDARPERSYRESDVRTARASRDESVRTSRPAADDGRPARTSGAEDDRDVRSSRPSDVQRRGARPSDDQGYRANRSGDRNPARGADASGGTARSAVPAGRRTAGTDSDEDFDYDFLQMDDDNDQ